MVHRIALLTVTIAALVGCSALTIDVDVYKGPLANDLEVRTQQIAALAMGAKPLLVELRDRLEWDCRRTRDAKQRQSWYRSDYMPTADPKTKGQFLNYDAERINDILGLYKDKSNEKLSYYIREGTAAARVYFESRKRFKTQDWTVDERKRVEKRWKAIERAADAAHVGKGREAEWGTRRKEILGHYKHLLAPEQGMNRSVDSLGTFWRERDANGDRADGSDAVARFASDTTRPDEGALIQALLQEKALAAQALYLLPAAADSAEEKLVATAREDFKLWMHEVGSAYIEGRKASERLVLLGLDFLIAVRSPEIALSAIERQRVVEAAAEIVAIFVNPRTLTVALASDVLQGMDRDWLIDQWMEATYPRGVQPERHVKAWGADGHERYAIAAKGIESLLSGEEGGRAALLLRQLHRRYKIAPASAVRTDAGQAGGGAQRQQDWHLHLATKWCASEASGAIVDKGYIDPLSRSFGIARTLSVEDSQETAKLREAQAQLAIIQEILGGLSGGRLQWGIETLTTTYVNAAHAAKLSDEVEPNWTKRWDERDRLFDALTRFARKVLVIADHQVLMGGRGDVELNAWDRPAVRTDQTIRTYALVLQSMGNSIEVLIDDIRREEKYEADNAERWQGQFAGIRAALPPEFRPGCICDCACCAEGDRDGDGNGGGAEEEDGGSTHEEVGDESGGDGEGGRGRIGDVHLHLLTVTKHQCIDDLACSCDCSCCADLKLEAECERLLAYLRAKHAQACVKNGQEPEADSSCSCERVIKQLEELLGRMQYIRGAGVYLRSSSAATGLQDNGLAWSNMLGEQALRGIPFYSPDGRRHDWEVREKIDNQFWQNVNRIRVAAAGRGNYALVKDPLGNWYVKGFSGNPSDMLASLRQTAGFLADASPAGVTLAQAKQSEAAMDASNKYLDTAKKDQKELTTLVASLREGLKKALEAQAADAPPDGAAPEDTADVDKSNETKNAVRPILAKAVDGQAESLAKKIEAALKDKPATQAGVALALALAEFDTFLTGAKDAINKAKVENSTGSGDPPAKLLDDDDAFRALLLEERQRAISIVVRQTGSLALPFIERRIGASRTQVENLETLQAKPKPDVEPEPAVDIDGG